MPAVGEGGGQRAWAASWEPRGEAKQAREPGGEDTPQGLPEEVVGASGLDLRKGRGRPTPGPARKSELQGLGTEAQAPVGAGSLRSGPAVVSGTWCQPRPPGSQVCQPCLAWC